MLFLGFFLGFMVFSTFADKFGRRTVLITLWSVGGFGSLLFLFSQNLIMVGFGEFLIGLGSSTGINLSLSFLAEVF